MNKKKSPEVTVLMAVYNGENYLQNAIDSILGQTFTDFEFIIINDGSTDRSLNIISAYQDPRIRIVDNYENIGLTGSLNHGLTLAEGQFVARQDADDISLKKRLEYQVAYMKKNPEVVLLGTQGMDIDESGKKLSCQFKPVEQTGIRWLLLFDNPFLHTSVLFRKDEIISEFSGYDEEFVCSQDYDLWSKIVMKHETANLGTVLVKKRACLNSISARMGRKDGVPLTKKVHYRNFQAVFGKNRINERHIELASKMRLGLKKNEIPELYKVFSDLLIKYLEIYPGAIKESDLKKTLSLQCLKFAVQAWKYYPVLALRGLIYALLLSPSIVKSQLLVLPYRIRCRFKNKFLSKGSLKNKFTF